MSSNPSKLEDFALVDRVIEGDDSASEELFEKYRDRIYRVVYGYTHNKDDALDITQEAFFKAFKKLETFKKESGFFTWLCQIAINKALDFLRKRKRRGPTLTLDTMGGIEPEARSQTDSPNPAEQAQVTELREAYLEALEELSEEHRTVYVLYSAEDLSYQEAADALDIPVGTVMSRIFYARKKLRELLSPHME